MKTVMIKPPYKALVQLRYCCVPCAIQWVLLRRGLKWIDQEEIAKCFDVKVPKKVKKYFTYNIKVTKKRSKYGTGEHAEEDMKRLIKNKKLPIKIKKSDYDEVKDYSSFITKNLKHGNDIMVTFHMRGIHPKKIKIGHMCVIAGIRLKKDPVIILGDPSIKAPKFWEWKLSKLINAMGPQFDGYKRSFYVVSKK